MEPKMIFVLRIGFEEHCCESDMQIFKWRVPGIIT